MAAPWSIGTVHRVRQHLFSRRQRWQIPNPPPYLTAIIPFSDAVAQGSFPITVSNGFALSNCSELFGDGVRHEFPRADRHVASRRPERHGRSGAVPSDCDRHQFPAMFHDSVERQRQERRPTSVQRKSAQQFSPADVSTVGTVNVTVFNPAPRWGDIHADLPFSISSHVHRVAFSFHDANGLNALLQPDRLYPAL